MRRSIHVIVVMCLMVGMTAALPNPASAHLQGAVWTTAADGAKVNANLYDQKCPPLADPCVTPPLVPFLSGGPNFASPTRWVPDGEYYFQVTDPSGKVLLSNDNIEARRFEVATDGTGKKYVIYPLGGNPAPHIVCNDFINGNLTIALCPFDDTPNNGGVYKLWITRVSDYNPSDPHARFGFIPAYCKTDNFKVKGLASVWGEKVDDVDDPVEGVCIILYEVKKVRGQETLVEIDRTCTDGDGEFSFTNLPTGKYAVDEDLLCTDCGGDFADWERLSPAGPIYFNITKADVGSKGKNAQPGLPIYVGQFVNEEAFPSVAALQGVKFLDVDGDGCLDPGETALAGWEICLEMKNGNGSWVQAVDLSDTPVPCQTTGADGSFNFGNLPVPMTYRISETPKPGWLQTGPNPSSTEMEDPCGDITTDPPGADVLAVAVLGRWIVNFGETADVLTIVDNLNFGNQLAEVCVEKLDACTELPIEGFEFMLYESDCETPAMQFVDPDGPGGVPWGWYEVAPKTTDATGTACWENVLGGDYCVVETDEPGWLHVTPLEQPVTAVAGSTTTLTFYNWAPSMGLTPGYWKNWRNHYTSAQFCELVQGTVADVDGCTADIAAADAIFEHWDASPGDEMTIVLAFLLANQLTLNLTQSDLPNPSEGSLVPGSSLECSGTPLVLGDVIDDALACLGDSCSRDDLLTIKNWLACFAESRYSTPPCLPI